MKSSQRIGIGTSAEGRTIEAWVRGTRGTLVIGGFHGDEPAGIELVREFLPHATGATAILPLLNPDGARRGTRYNARGVDLNRNFDHRWSAASIEPPGPAPWSEPETRALRDFILHWQPARIVTLHWALGEIDADGLQSAPLARAMWHAMTAAERAPYRLLAPALGAPAAPVECPGSLGQWAGHGLVYSCGTRPAIVTLELPHDPALPRPATLPADHVEAVRRAWAQDPHRYLRGVRGGVEKMLHAACAISG